MKEKYKIETLRKILIKKPNDKKTLELLGLFLTNEEKYHDAISYLEKAIELGSQLELVFLGLYISYNKLSDYNKSIAVLKKYLENNPAVLFRDTVEELITDLQNGYAINYKETIINLAKKNNIPIPDELIV